MKRLFLLSSWLLCMCGISAQEIQSDSYTSDTSSETLSNISAPPFFWAMKTNTLYDLALIPNVGVEVYVGRQWSVAANGMYAWWSNRGSDKFWRIYGGDVEVRRWLGKKAAEKPLQGHHVGVYGQLLTYDMTFNGRGYLGDKWSYAFGLSYGYSLSLIHI